MSELARANRVSVQAVGEIEGVTRFEARFFRTHKQIGTVLSADTSWQPEEGQNKTMQRELFRTWVCDSAAQFGIDWDPQDKRMDQNKRVPKYTGDEVLMYDAAELVRKDVTEFVDGCDVLGLMLMGLVAEEIEPMEKSPKGADLSKMGILDGKYANGNWAWATVKVVATVGLPEIEGAETYVTLECLLVSGQLKKPTGIDGAGYNQTSFKEAVLKDLGEFLAKDNEGTVEDSEPVEEAQVEAEPVVEKKSRRSKKAE